MAAGKAPVTRGKRNPALLVKVRDENSIGTRYVCGAKPMRMGHRVLTVGVEVPGASTWPRVDAWVRSRHIRLISPEETFTSFDDFAATWDEDHPETVPMQAPLPELEVTETKE